jgi:hypothetical protein
VRGGQKRVKKPWVFKCVKKKITLSPKGVNSPQNFSPEPWELLKNLCQNFKHRSPKNDIVRTMTIPNIPAPRVVFLAAEREKKKLLLGAFESAEILCGFVGAEVNRFERAPHQCSSFSTAAADDVVARAVVQIRA